MEDITRYISLLCPVCGSSLFESVDEQYEELDNASDEALIRCFDCGTTYTKEKLIQENIEKIGIAVAEMKDEVVGESIKEIKKVMKKWKL